MNSTERTIRAIKAQALREAASATFPRSITDASGVEGVVHLGYLAPEDREWLRQRAVAIEAGHES